MTNVTQTGIRESNIQSLECIGRGKVRDIYALDADHLLIVATDRLSAYDVVLPDTIPGKGAVLTAISKFWFEQTKDIIQNHTTELTIADFVSDPATVEKLRAQSMVVKRLSPLPMESVVRGYLIGSGWRDYLATGKLCGILLPAGLAQAARLEQPLFTPATKAAQGDHDENISFAQLVDLIGYELASTVRDISLEIFSRCADLARARGVIIADTKLEFGQDPNGELYLIDEILTPDSSRFWPIESYRPGTSPPSFDKQFVRDYLDTLDWDKTDPGPGLPGDVIEGTAERYAAVARLLGLAA